MSASDSGSEAGLCGECEEEYCTWTEHGPGVLETVAVDLLVRDPENKFTQGEKRKLCYQRYVTVVFGVLGGEKRKKLPKCVLDGVREVYPDFDGNYMGHMDE